MSGQANAAVQGPVTERGRRTRAAIVASARDVFETNGFHDTTMSDLAAAADVSHGTVYTYFDSKEAVLSEVCRGLVTEMFAAVRVPDDLRSDPVTRIEEGNRRYLAAYIKHARMLEVVEQAATTEPHFRDLIDDLRRVFVDKATGTLRHFQADGLVEESLRPDIAGPALVGMVESFARRWHEHEQTYEPEQVVRTLTRLWARAIGLPDPAPATRGATR